MHIHSSDRIYAANLQWWVAQKALPLMYNHEAASYDIIHYTTNAAIRQRGWQREEATARRLGGEAASLPLRADGDGERDAAAEWHWQVLIDGLHILLILHNLLLQACKHNITS